MNDIQRLRDELHANLDPIEAGAPQPPLLHRARRRRRATVAATGIITAACVVLLVAGVMTLLRDRTQQVRPGAGAPPAMLPAPMITEDMLDLPASWGGLRGRSLADAIGLRGVVGRTCDDPWTPGPNPAAGWCLDDAGKITEVQRTALMAYLADASLSDDLWQGRLAQALVTEAQRAGDVVTAADIRWRYLDRPHLLESEAQLSKRTTPVTPAAEGEPTYIFSDIHFSYPYVPAGVDGAQPDPGFAGYAFSSDWSGDTYPGEARCEVRLIDAQGRDVGGYWGGWAQNPRHVTYPFGDLPEQPVRVTGVPVSATWACSEGAVDSRDRATDFIAGLFPRGDIRVCPVGVGFPPGELPGISDAMQAVTRAAKEGKPFPWDQLDPATQSPFPSRESYQATETVATVADFWMTTADADPANGSVVDQVRASCGDEVADAISTLQMTMVPERGHELSFTLVFVNYPDGRQRLWLSMPGSLRIH